MVIKDYSNDLVLTGDGYTFPYLNWSMLDGMDLTGDGTESFIPEFFLPDTKNLSFCYNLL